MKLITTLLSDESTVEADRQWARETLELIKFFDSEQDKAISFADSMEKIDFLMKEELERFSPFRVHLAAILHLRRFFQPKEAFSDLVSPGYKKATRCGFSPMHTFPSSSGKHQLRENSLLLAAASCTDS